MKIKFGKNVIQKVVSKYFTEEHDMDESSDFQEKKEYNVNKTLQKLTLDRKKKSTKRIKGQKDIRAALKATKNEHILYSEEFDKVCKKSGIDVDAEQLQIAIALSKSLHQTNSATASIENISRRGNTEKIRTTLLEYGFKVPEIKIEKNNRRPKKHRKPYKLLITSDFEKTQIITDRYSQVLFDNDGNQTLDTAVTDIDVKSLHYLATNVPYDFIRENQIFYVKDLVQSSRNSVGSLLRDWSMIPGRPISPVISNIPGFRIAESDYKQEEIDKILSGTVKTAQNIIQNFTRKELSFINEVRLNSCFSDSNNKTMSVQQSNNSNDQQERSGSPDIFDDEVSLLFDKSHQKLDTTVGEAPTTNTQYQNSMDLTECVLTGKHNFIKTASELQDSNETKRKSNDFMEITECIASSSQPKFNHKPENITPSKRRSIIQNIDNSVIEVDSKVNVKQENIDLTQSSDSSDLPDVSLTSTNNSNKEEIIILHQKVYSGTNCPIASVSIDSDNEADNELGPTDITTVYSNSDAILDLSLEIGKSIVKEKDLSNFTNKSDRSFIVDGFFYEKEEYLTQTSELSQEDSNLYFASGNKSAKISYGSLGKQDDVSVDYDEILNIDDEAVLSNNDEHILPHSENVLLPNYTDKKNNNADNNSKTSNSKSSQDFEVFEILDNELDYSIQQSRLEAPKDNFVLGGLSILNNEYSTNTNNCSRISKENLSLNISMLPEVKVKNNDHESLDAENSAPTPSKDYNSVVSIVTPKSDYIIKTDQVTPMLDYATMDTPDRNKELEKYGLKPFKRKRAIQLLTHLYTQTHPIIEDVNKEDLPCPAKKSKAETASNSKQCSPRKIISKSPKKSTENMEPKMQQCLKQEEQGKKNSGENIYNVTKIIPDLRDLPCDPEDWVFQKKEKAKIHGCKVPLHIAFHNYLSCRLGLREAILRYEPVNIDIIHKDLVAMGYKYDPKDLLRFLDKKCITVKTAENNSRHNRK